MYNMLASVLLCIYARLLHRDLYRSHKRAGLYSKTRECAERVKYGLWCVTN
jgi:hypothetical protein